MSTAGVSVADASAVRGSYVAMRQAMVARDVDALDACLADTYLFTHMTGYVQPRNEWLDAVRSGEMAYHSVEDAAVSVELDHGAPTLTARTLTDATIWGIRGTWRLQLRTTYVRKDGQWKAAATRASTW
jgi:hypothetical protein